MVAAQHTIPRRTELVVDILLATKMALVADMRHVRPLQLYEKPVIATILSIGSTMVRRTVFYLERNAERRN